MADAAHQLGNDFYKKGDLENAEMSYVSAYKLDPSEPKYASNLSAVYYEKGQYDLCIDSIINSWRSLRVKNSVDGNPSTPPTTDPLPIKLSLRFLKAKLNSVAKGLVSLHAKKKKNKGKTSESNTGIEQDIQTFCSDLLEKDATSRYSELRHIWGVWQKTKEDCQSHTAEECKKKLEEAQKRLRALPIFKGTLYDVVEYFKFGHDHPRPLFYEIGSYEDAYLLINEGTVLVEDWKKISFLFGGSGDGRHIFATLMNWGAIWKRIRKRPHLNDVRIPDLHLTLLDLHPAPLARVMLILAMIRKGMTATNAKTKLELDATAFYVWSTFLMPDYCAKWVTVISQEIIEELKGNSQKHLTKFWVMDQVTMPRILTILEYWSKPLAKSTTNFFEINAPKDLNQPHIRTSLKQRREARDERFNSFVATATEIKRSPFDLRKDTEFPLYNDWNAEDGLFQQARIFLPPKQFLNRHPVLRQHVKSGRQQVKIELLEEVFRDWKPNPTLFDDNTTENIAFSQPGGCPKLSFDEDLSLTMVGWLEVVRHYRDVHTQLSFDQTSVNIMQQVFDTVRECFAFVDSREDALTLEFVCTEICSGLPKLMAGDFGPRPSSFPTKYMRMWLSNIPDYTGGVLSNLVYLVPYLEDSHYAAILWNCLRNQGAFGSLKDFCFNYTYLTSSGIQRYFNCLIRDENNKPSEAMSLSIAKRKEPFSSRVSKKELFKYLSWILLRVLCCPRAALAPYEVDEPTNMVTFIRLLIAFCQTFGCPGHWVGEFAQNMVNDTLVTNAMPFDGILPVLQMPAPTPTERKINLEPYQLELESILLTIKDALPFHISYPSRYADSIDSIKAYSTNITSTANLPYEYPVQYNAGCLLFYRTNPIFHAACISDLPSRIPELIESRDGTIRGIQVQILSTIDVMDFQKCVVSWRMSEGWYNRMKEEGWSMIVWISNRRRTVSKPAPASEWVERPNAGLQQQA